MMEGCEWVHTPFDQTAVGHPPPILINPHPCKKAQTTKQLSAPHFFLDKLSQCSAENFAEHWDNLPKSPAHFCESSSHSSKNVEQLKKFLFFAGKRHSCRSPPDFRCFPAHQRNPKEETECLTERATTP